MTLYIDRLNGVWSYKPEGWQPGQDRWMLVAKTDHFDHRDFVLGTTEPDNSVKFLAPFTQLEGGKKFQFEYEPFPGEHVWIDASVLDSFSDWNAYDSTTRQVVAEYAYTTTDESGKEYAVVSTSVRVPPEAIKRYGTRANNDR